MVLIEKWPEIYVKFHEGFNSPNAAEHDQRINDIVEEFVDESLREWVLKVPKDIEEGLFLALKCFRAARDLYENVEGPEVQEANVSLKAR